ncbi:restriction endonuclease subunit S [Vibrio lentus]|uniref:restriction endonuclease subunit S n=1 Tax=Vibrio lentus TaxID=136468 RepID=UPI001E5C695A|nr:restriction endonuclease subunit S [Vibrio lentus]MCC4782729.1 restriction endonuclease subunit S [Vibrio lentus]
MSNALKLGDVAVVKGGSGFPEKYQGGSNGLPFIKVSDMNLPGNQRYIWKSNNYLNTTVYNLLRPTVFPRDTVVFAKVGAAVYLNKRRILTEDTAIDNNLMGVTATAIEPLFLYYLLQSIDLAEWVQPGALPSINQTIIEDLPIPITDRKQQRYISEVLNAVDNQIDATQALIDKYTAIKQGVMADLFSRGIDPETKALRPTFEDAPDLYHETPLGMLPKGWDVEVLGDLASIASGITLGKDLSGVRTVLVPYLRVANVQDGYLDLSEVKSIAVPKVDAGKYVLQYGDVLMNEGGDFDKLGRGTVWREEIPGCCHQNHVFRVRADTRKLRFDYLAYWSASSFGKHYFVLNSKQSTNLASVNSTQLKAFPVAKPTLEEQEEIESRLQSVDGLLRSSKDELHKLNVQKSGLMQDLLTGKVSVPA